MGFLPKYEDSPQSDCSNTDADATCSLPSKFSLSKHSTVKNLSSSSQGDTQSRTLPVQPSTISGTPAINIDSLINNIYSLLKSEASGEQNVVSELEITVLCDLASRVFLRQPSLLELNPADSGLTIVGDLHGHLNDLSSIFKKEGGPDVHNYLFLGNYVGIGRHQVELIALLLACKLKYPENFFLLRGSHESRETNHTDGFWHRCWDMYQNEQVWTKLNHCFDTMPYAAVLGDRILCVHSGLSPHLQTMLQLRNIKRPVPIPPNGLLYDLVSAAPTVITPGWNTNQQNTAMIFGHGVWKKFFKANELEFMIRSHGVSEFQHVWNQLIDIQGDLNRCAICGPDSVALASVTPALKNIGRRCFQQAFEPKMSFLSLLELLWNTIHASKI